MMIKMFIILTDDSDVKICNSGAHNMMSNASSIKDFSRITLAEWMHAVNNNYVHVECSVSSIGSFEGHILNGYTGSISGSICYSTIPMKYHRTLKKIRYDPVDDFQVMLLEEGRATVIQNERIACLNPGDMVIYEASSPFTLSFETAYRTRTIKIPGEKMCIDRPHFRDMTAIPLSGLSKAGRIAKKMAAELSGYGEDELCEFTNSVIEDSFISFLYSVLRKETGVSNITTRSKLDCLKDFVIDNIGDTSLCAESVAVKFGISVRTLNRLFSESGNTFNSWLWYKRTEYCFNDLKRKKSAKILEVVYENGFSDLSHFYRLFRKYYNCTPASIKRN